MGEAKRRKAVLGDAYGKKIVTELAQINHTKNHRTNESAIVQQLIHLSDALCLRLFDIANSREIIGGLIEIPGQDTEMKYLINRIIPNEDEDIRHLRIIENSTQMMEYAKRRKLLLAETDQERLEMEHILSQISAPTEEEKKTRASVIECLIDVCDYHRKKYWSIWCDIYELLSMLDSSDIVDALKNKNRLEIDHCLRAMILLQSACPSPDTEEELWDRYWKKNITPSHSEIKICLFQRLSFMQEETNRSGSKRLEDFCEQVGKLLHNNWNQPLNYV
jgi:hypothetical protein